MGKEVTYGPAVRTQVDGPRVERPPPGVQYVLFSDQGASSEVVPIEGSVGWPSSVGCGPRDRSRVDVVNIPFANWGVVPALAPGGKLVIPRMDEYAIDLVDARTGDTVRTLRRDVPQIPVTDDVWERQPEVIRLRNLEAEAGERFVDVNDAGSPCRLEASRPEHAPSIRTVIASPDGQVWVESPTPEGFELALFDPQGTLLGVGSMPERDASVPPYARGNRLYLVVKDALDVQSIEIYEVQPVR